MLRDDAEVLGVGAGHEATIYWLTRKVGKVVATDLYRTEDEWSEGDSGADMLTDPGRYWDGPWNPDRLVVKHMNALELEFEDESFDAVFSSSSIEHFGDFARDQASGRRDLPGAAPGRGRWALDRVPARGARDGLARACSDSTSRSCGP